MRIGLYIIFILITAACHEVKVGYLETEGALYDPDTMEIKIITDKTETGPHWISPPIQGVEGTQPICYTIEAVKTEDGDEVEFLKEIKVRGDGTFDIPFQHTIPAGSYVVSLRVRNEGYSKVIKDVFTFLVKE